MANPEHTLQVMVNKWVRTCVPQPHFFTGIDRSKKSGAFTHVREKARGLVSGMSDTILVVPGLPLIAIELKAPGNKPTQRQYDVGKAIYIAGGLWGWTNSVSGYCGLLQDWGVPMQANAPLLAQAHDATLEAASIRREEGKTGKVSVRRVRPAKPSTARVKKVEAVRSRVQF